MLSPEAAPRTISRLFRADGDHITDLQIPVSYRPVQVVLGISRVSNTRAQNPGVSRFILKRPPSCSGDRMMLLYVAWMAIWRFTIRACGPEPFHLMQESKA